MLRPGSQGNSNLQSNDLPNHILDPGGSPADFEPQSPEVRRDLVEALSGPVPLLGRIGTEGQRAVGTAGTGAGQAAPQMTPKLTPRLQQTLARLLDGKSEKEIARNLNLSQHTIHQYTKSLHRHFGVSSRAELLSRFIPRADQMRPPAAFHAQS